MGGASTNLMRIAIVTTSWPAYSGDPSGHFVQAEARELEQGGHGDVVVVAPPCEATAFGWPGVVARVRAAAAATMFAADNAFVFISAR